MARNPVADALVDTIARFNLDKERLLALIEARSFDLYDDPMPSEAALENYLRDTSAGLFEAIARVLAAGRLPPPCVAEAGRAYGLTALLRGLPWQVMKGQLFLPLDTLARYQLPPDHVLAHRNSPGLGIVLNDLRARVRRHLAALQSGLADAGPAATACLPPSASPTCARWRRRGLTRSRRRSSCRAGAGNGCCGGRRGAFEGDRAADECQRRQLAGRLLPGISQAIGRAATSDTPQARALKAYRKRLSERGMARFEVLGLDKDRGLVRALARRLADNGPEASRIRAAFMRTIEDRPPDTGGMYAALRRSPLVGADIDMPRSRDPDSDSDL